MDRRFINAHYSLGNMQVLSVLCRFILPNDTGIVSAVPVVLADKITVRLDHEESPVCSALSTYWRVSEDGNFVLYYDPESEVLEDRIPEVAAEFPDEFATHTIPFYDPEDLWERIVRLFQGEDPTE